MRPHLTHRGAVLLPLAVIWVVTGTRLLVGPDATPGFMLPIEYLPMWARVGLWWGAAAVAAATAWTPRLVTAGYVALVLPAGLRFTSYGGAVLLGHAHAALLLDVVTWAAITAAVMLVARRTEC